jgi:hypothetical protein
MCGGAMSAIFNIGGMRKMQVAVVIVGWALSYKIKDVRWVQDEFGGK